MVNVAAVFVIERMVAVVLLTLLLSLLSMLLLMLLLSVLSAALGSPLSGMPLLQLQLLLMLRALHQNQNQLLRPENLRDDVCTPTSLRYVT